MSRPWIITFEQRAVEELERENEWWRANTAYPEKVVDSLSRALDFLRIEPFIGAAAQNVALKGVRRVLLDEVSLLLYYRIRPRKRVVEVLAVWPAKKGTGPGLQPHRSPQTSNTRSPQSPRARVAGVAHARAGQAAGSHSSPSAWPRRPRSATTPARPRPGAGER